MEYTKNSQQRAKQLVASRKWKGMCLSLSLFQWKCCFFSLKKVCECWSAPHPMKQSHLEAPALWCLDRTPLTCILLYWEIPWSKQVKILTNSQFQVPIVNWHICIKWKLVWMVSYVNKCLTSAASCRGWDSSDTRDHLISQKIWLEAEIRNWKFWMFISSKWNIYLCFAVHWTISKLKSNILILTPSKKLILI